MYSIPSILSHVAIRAMITSIDRENDYTFLLDPNCLICLAWLSIRLSDGIRAAIDLARSGTIKHVNPCALGPRYVLAYEWILEWMASGWVSYNGLLLCNPGCKPHCLAYLARGQQSHKDRLPTRRDWRLRALSPKPGWSVARVGLGKLKRVNIC